MPKFESAPNLNNPELNPSELEAGVDIERKPEGELTPEELEKLKTEEKTKAEKPELSPEEQLKNKEKLEKLQAEQKALEKQKEKLISQQKKERLIREEKEKILQEKLDELFKGFEALTPRDFESIFKSGRTREGRNVESASMGELDPEVAQSLAKAFKEGIKLLPKILEALPELLKKFDEDLTKEATERVEQKLEEEKKMEEKQPKEEKPAEQKPEEKPGAPESKIPTEELKQGPSIVEGGNIESPKA